MMELELKYLRLIQTVAADGGLTTAGKTLHLSQSALSHQLRTIEERLGVALFVRANKTMVLTAAGARLLQTAEVVLDAVGRAEEDIRDLAGQRRGVLRIAAVCYTTYHWLPPLLRQFAERFPDVTVRIVPEATSAPEEALLTGKVDVVITYRPLKDDRFVAKKLFSDELVAVVAPDHPLATRTSVRAEDFRDEDLLSYGGLTQTTLFQSVLSPAGVVPRRVIEVPLTEAMLELVKAGLGISVLSRWAALPQLENGALRALRVTPRGLRRRWWTVRLKNAPTPAFLDEFLRLLAEGGMASDIRASARKSTVRRTSR